MPFNYLEPVFSNIEAFVEGGTFGSYCICAAEVTVWRREVSDGYGGLLRMFVRLVPTLLIFLHYLDA